MEIEAFKQSTHFLIRQFKDVKMRRLSMENEE